MNASLAEKTCTPCRGGVPPLGRNEAERPLEQAPDWALLDEASRIERAAFRPFASLGSICSRHSGASASALVNPVT